MARVTVEDCLKNVKNRFELVIIAAKRARQLMRGKEPKVEWDNDKPTVVALREIAAGYTDFTPQTPKEEPMLSFHTAATTLVTSTIIEKPEAIEIEEEVIVQSKTEDAEEKSEDSVQEKNPRLIQIKHNAAIAAAASH